MSKSITIHRLDSQMTSVDKTRNILKNESIKYKHSNRMKYKQGNNSSHEISSASYLAKIGFFYCFRCVFVGMQRRPHIFLRENDT